MTPSILFVNFGEEEADYCMKVMKQLREQGIACELYPTAAKMKKQMSYADKRGYEYVAMVGSSEVERDMLTVKNMRKGEQEELSPADLLKLLKS